MLNLTPAHQTFEASVKNYDAILPAFQWRGGKAEVQRLGPRFEPVNHGRGDKAQRDGGVIYVGRIRPSRTLLSPSRPDMATTQ